MLSKEAYELTLSYDTCALLGRCANEGAHYNEPEAAHGSAPDAAMSQQIWELVHAGDDLGGFDIRAVSVPARLVPTLLQLIPAAVALLDDDEREIRTTNPPGDFPIAQAELVRALAAAGYDA